MVSKKGVLLKLNHLLLLLTVIVLLGIPITNAVTEEPGGISSVTIAFIGKPSENFFNEVMDQGGFYAKNGLLVEPRYFNSGEEAGDSVLSGETDFAVLNSYSIAELIHQKKNPQIISSVARIDGIYSIVADKDKGIRSPSDLQGKRIGLVQENDWEFYLDKFFIINGIEGSSVELIQLSSEEITPGLVAGEIDAGLVNYGKASAICRQYPERFQMWSLNDQETFHQVLMCNKKLIENHPEVIERLIRSFVNLGEWYNGNIETVKQMISVKMKLSPDQVQDLMTGISPEVSLTQGLLSILEEQSRYIVRKEGDINQSTPNYLQIIAFSFLDKIYPERDTIIHE